LTPTKWCGEFDYDLACPAGCFGTFAGWKGNGHPLPCFETLPGYYSPENSTKLSACSEGYYSNYSRASECTPCPTGWYARSKKSTECRPCPAGYTQPQEGQVDCAKCDPLYYNGPGANDAVNNTEGYYCRFVAPPGPTFAPSVSTSPTATPSVAPSAPIDSVHQHQPTIVSTTDIERPSIEPSQQEDVGGSSIRSSTAVENVSPTLTSSSQNQATTPRVSSFKEASKSPIVIAAASLCGVFGVIALTVLCIKKPLPRSSQLGSAAVEPRDNDAYQYHDADGRDDNEFPIAEWRAPEHIINNRSSRRRFSPFPEVGAEHGAQHNIINNNNSDNSIAPRRRFALPGGGVNNPAFFSPIEQVVDNGVPEPPRGAVFVTPFAPGDDEIGSSLSDETKESETAPTFEEVYAAVSSPVEANPFSAARDDSAAAVMAVPEVADWSREPIHESVSFTFEDSEDDDQNDLPGFGSFNFSPISGSSQF
jgi:hypothetical protein